MIWNYCTYFTALFWYQVLTELERLQVYKHCKGRRNFQMLCFWWQRKSPALTWWYKSGWGTTWPGQFPWTFQYWSTCKDSSPLWGRGGGGNLCLGGCLATSCWQCVVVVQGWRGNCSRSYTLLVISERIHNAPHSEFLKNQTKLLQIVN